MPPAISRRHAFRATWHPYNDGIYFVTICCRDKKCMLGRISDDRMTLSELGMIVDDCIISIPTHFPEVEIWNHIVMPNHIHMVVYVGPQYIAPESAYASTSSVNRGCLRPPNHGEECENYHHNSRLSVIVGAFKAAVTRTARARFIAPLPASGVWQRSFHEHIIRDQRAFDNIMLYIDDNVARWSSDCFHPR